MLIQIGGKSWRAFVFAHRTAAIVPIFSKTKQTKWRNLKQLIFRIQVKLQLLWREKKTIELSSEKKAKTKKWMDSETDKVIDSFYLHQVHKPNNCVFANLFHWNLENPCLLLALDFLAWHNEHYTTWLQPWFNIGQKLSDNTKHCWMLENMFDPFERILMFLTMTFFLLV